MNAVLLTIGAVFVMLWGISHIFPTKSVVKGFGDISKDNKHIITMEWINEGLTLVFIGSVVLITAYWGDEAIILSRIVNSAAGIMLISMAVLSLFTGFKVKFLPFKLCPLIFSVSAVLILLGTFL